MTADAAGTAPIADADAGRAWTAFRLYTLWSLGIAMLLAPFLLMAPAARDAPVTGPGAWVLLMEGIACAGTTVLLFREWAAGAPGPRARWGLPEAGALRSQRRGRWLLPVLVLLPVAVSALALTEDPAPPAAHRVVACLGAALAALAVRGRWLWALPAAAATVAVGSGLGLDASALGAVAGMVIALVGMVRSSLWLAALVRELDRARGAQSELAVAEERLRFARDLHDVTGRDLSAIVVTAELTGKLIERADPRALERSREVAQIARSSLAEVRALVRGYRDADLAAELRGTASLLRSAGIDVEISGDPAAIPSEHTAAAAWVLREAGTNVLRHSRARSVRIALSADAISVENDGAAHEAPEFGSGLRGLAERLAPGGLEVDAHDGRFVLTAGFAAAADQPGRSPLGSDRRGASA